MFFGQKFSIFLLKYYIITIINNLINFIFFKEYLDLLDFEMQNVTSKILAFQKSWYSRYYKCCI